MCLFGVIDWGYPFVTNLYVNCMSWILYTIKFQLSISDLYYVKEKIFASFGNPKFQAKKINITFIVPIKYLSFFFKSLTKKRNIFVLSFEKDP